MFAFDIESYLIAVLKLLKVDEKKTTEFCYFSKKSYVNSSRVTLPS